MSDKKNRFPWFLALAWSLILGIALGRPYLHIEFFQAYLGCDMVTAHGLGVLVVICELFGFFFLCWFFLVRLTEKPLKPRKPDEQ